MSETTNKPVPKKKKKGKTKVQKIFILIFGALAILLAFAAAVFFLVFKVRKIEVKGTVPYPTAKIIETSGIKMGSNLFLLDKEATADSLESGLAYLSDVKIETKLPSTVVIKAETAQCTFAIKTTGDTYAVTDGKLKVLENVAAVPENAIIVEGKLALSDSSAGKTAEFTGGKEDEKIKKALTEISRAMAESDITGITLVNVSDTNNIYAIYDSRIVIKLGDTSDVLRKLALAKMAIDEENKLSQTQYGEMDVTVLKKAIYAPKDYKDIPEILELMKLEHPELFEEETEESDETGEDGTGENEENTDEGNEASTDENEAETGEAEPESIEADE